MTLALVPLIASIVGALVYALTSGKLSELGRVTFAVGLFWLVYTLAGKGIHLS